LDFARAAKIHVDENDMRRQSAQIGFRRKLDCPGAPVRRLVNVLIETIDTRVPPASEFGT